MRFEVTRTSDWHRERPCPEAIKGKPFGPGHIWHIDFETVDELVRFVEKYGEVVVSPPDSPYREAFEVEIYDNYRE